MVHMHPYGRTAFDSSAAFMYFNQFFFFKFYFLISAIQIGEGMMERFYKEISRLATKFFPQKNGKCLHYSQGPCEEHPGMDAISRQEKQRRKQAEGR